MNDSMATFDAFTSLILEFATLLGITLFILGLYNIYRRADNPQRYTLASCFKSLLSGSMLLIVGSIYSIFRRSTIDPSWSMNGRESLGIGVHINESISSANSSVLGLYVPERIWAVILGFLFVVGLYSFVKGVFLVRSVGAQDESGQYVGFKKVGNHLFFGMVAMNITMVGGMFTGLVSMLRGG